MKKIIAIAAIIASAQASAFFDNSNGSMNGANKANGDFLGNGSTDTNGTAYGYESPYYAAPVAPVAK